MSFQKFSQSKQTLCPNRQSLCVMVIEELVAKLSIEGTEEGANNGQDDSAVGHALQYMGHRVFYARRSFEALQMLSAMDFDLIFIDLELSGIDSFATAELIQAFEAARRRSVPIVALRDTMAPDEQKRCEAAGILTRIPTGLFEPMQEAIEKPAYKSSWEAATSWKERQRQKWALESA